MNFRIRAATISKHGAAFFKVAAVLALIGATLLGRKRRALIGWARTSSRYFRRKSESSPTPT